MSTKISALPPSAGLVLTDIFPVVDDPGGTPATQKATVSQLSSVLAGNFVLKAGDTMTGALVHPVGAVGTPSITFAGDLDTGVYHPSANEVGFSSNGFQTLRISAGGSAVFSVNINGISGNMTGSWNAASLGASNALFSPMATVLATNNGSGSVSIGNFTTDPNDPPVIVHTFLGNGDLGFFVATPVPQQSAAGNTLAEVLAALRAYGLLAP